MSGLQFDWDARKDAANRHKHGVSFVEASSVFFDEEALLIDDPDHSGAEPRFLLLGLSAAARLLLVVHCYRGLDEEIRIISARPATRIERTEYSRRRF